MKMTAFWLKNFTAVIVIGLLLSNMSTASAASRKNKRIRKRSVSSSIQCIGKPADFIAINSTNDLNQLRSNPTGKFFLCKNLSFFGLSSFIPIESFNGILDGNSKIISHLRIDTRLSLKPAGLIGVLGENGEIKRLTLSENTITGYTQVGGFAGISNGKITSSSIRLSQIGTNTSSSIFIAPEAVGGIAGVLDGGKGSITTSRVDSSDIAGGVYTGGLVGRSSGKIRINAFGTTYYERVSISLSVVSANVTGLLQLGSRISENVATGGLVGSFTLGNISDSDFVGSVASAGITGGLVGDLKASSIISSRSSGAVSGLPSITGNGFLEAFAVGGAVGRAAIDLTPPHPLSKQVIIPVSLSKISSEGTVTGGRTLGGIVGNVLGHTLVTGTATIADSSSKATLTGNQTVGELVGSGTGFNII